MLSPAQIAESWKELQQIVEVQSKNEKAGEPRFQSTIGKLFLIGMWQVEARFDDRSEHQVIFDRFGAQGGRTNFEDPRPGSRLPGPEAWTLTPVEGSTKIFWRFREQDLSADVLAARIVKHLKDFYEQYKLAAIA